MERKPVRCIGRNRRRVSKSRDCFYVYKRRVGMFVGSDASTDGVNSSTAQWLGSYFTRKGTSRRSADQSVSFRHQVAGIAVPAWGRSLRPNFPAQFLMTAMPSPALPTAPDADTPHPGCALRDHLSLLTVEQARCLDELLSPQGDAVMVSRLRRYMDCPRGLLYRRAAGQGGFWHGMAAMLIVPARDLESFAAVDGPLVPVGTTTVLGISLPESGNDGESGQPTMFVFDATRLPNRENPARARPSQVMAMPAWLPGWFAFPAHGVHAGWQALDAPAPTATGTLAQWMARVACATLDNAIARSWGRRLVGNRLTAEHLEDLRRALARIELEIARQVLLRFQEHLNPIIAQECMSRRGSIAPAEYNWVAGGRTARTWEWRMEALEVFPALCTSAVHEALPIRVSAGVARRSKALMRLKAWAEAPPLGAA